MGMVGMVGMVGMGIVYNGTKVLDESPSTPG
jgi:hypothetical protein